MHRHTALHSIKLRFVLDTFLRQLLRALLEHTQKRHNFWKMVKCLLETVYVDKYFSTFSCLQSLCFIVMLSLFFNTADKTTCHARVSIIYSPKQMFSDAVCQVKDAESQPE